MCKGIIGTFMAKETKKLAASTIPSWSRSAGAWEKNSWAAVKLKVPVREYNQKTGTMKNIELTKVKIASQ